MKKERLPFIVFLARLILPWYYRLVYGLKMEGYENIPKEGPVILASNHVTGRDPLFLGCGSHRQIHYMAKDSLFKNPFLSKLIRYAGAFPVIRGTGGADALQNAFELLEKGKVIGVFIEGTRSKDGEPLRPKTGVSLLAFQTKAPVVPVAIVGKDGKCPKSFSGGMRIKIGKPIPFEDMGMEEETSMHYRRGAKYIMGKIVELRSEAIEEMNK